MSIPLAGELSPAWPVLCDLVASDRLICFTGAGISSTLERKAGGKLPQWPQLLRELLDAMRPRLTAEDIATCEALLGVKNATGDMLIEAASIIERVDPKAFELELRAATDPVSGRTTPAHRALDTLMPRGTVTLNYDEAHENAFVHPIDVLLPYDEERLAEHLRRNLDARFLLKAHGSIGSPQPLVLTYASYRELLVRRPAYRAFMNQLLTNFNMLFYGFGMTDPDFDIAIRTLLDQFGAPIREHVLVRIAKDDADARGLDTLLWSRYRIHSFHVEKFDDVPALLGKTLWTPGPRMKRLIDGAITGDHDTRNAAHVGLRALGPVGRRCAQEVFRRKLVEYDANAHYLSEVAYALGDLAPEENKDVLLKLVGDELVRRRPDPPARALTVLRPALVVADIPLLESWIPLAETLPDDPDYRVAAYLRYLIVYVKSKFRSDLTKP